MNIWNVGSGVWEIMKIAFFFVYEIASTAALDGFNAEIDIGPSLKWGRKVLI